MDSLPRDAPTGASRPARPALLDAVLSMQTPAAGPGPDLGAP